MSGEVHQVFICYSHADEALRAELDEHLALLVRERRIRPWHDRAVGAGEEWRGQIDAHLEAADFIVLLVSSAFISSDYCWDVETTRALERHSTGKAWVIPVIVRPCDWRTAPFAELHVLPKDGKPVTEWANRDAAWSDVVRSLRTMLDGLGCGAPAAEIREPRDELQPVPADKDKRTIEEQILDPRRRYKGPQMRGEFLADGRYELLELAGRGGFATVWKAWDREAKRLVAIKVLHKHLGNDSSMRARFFRGARIMADLSHPHIVPVFECEMVEEGWHYFVMEYVGGGNLEQAVLGGEQPFEKCVEWLMQVGEALELAHRRGVVHRDVKPSNILLDKDLGAKLTDFDLVRTEDTTGLTATRVMMGTVEFAAPEVLEAAPTLKPAADVYSLGSTTVFAVLGERLPAWYYRDPMKVIVGLDCEKALKRVLARATAFEEDERFASIDQFCQALETASLVAMAASGIHPSGSSLAPGAVLFDQWRLVCELGRGRFGVVFAAEELHLGETHAVKVLDPAMTSRPDLLTRFRREITVLGRLDSRYIIRVFDFREDLKQHLALISMEYVAGSTVEELRDLARRKQQPVPVAVVVAILAETLEALAEAHDQELSHRAVTPGNILLAGADPESLLAAETTSEPLVKLVDFGVAGLMDHMELLKKTQALGTAPYMAPEVIVPGGEDSPAVDVYSAAAVAYELLTGKLPLGRFPRPSATRTDVPPKLDRLVLELLDLDPAKRPTARRAQALSRAIGASVARHKAARRRTGRWVWLALAAGIAVASLLVMVSSFNARRSGQQPPGAATVQDGPRLPTGSAKIEAAISPVMLLRYIPSGSYIMGSPESESGRSDIELQHEVTLTRGFWMAETEVTQAQWRAVMDTDPSYFTSCGDDCPVERVSWFDAVLFANRLSELGGFDSCYELGDCEGIPGNGCPHNRKNYVCTGRYRCKTVEFRSLDCGGYRLPTEAEWEYAARSGTEYTRPLTIHELGEIAWYATNSQVGYDGGYRCLSYPGSRYSPEERCGTHRVGQKLQTGWGLHDMLGNVKEWTWDWYSDYGSGPMIDPVVSSRSKGQVIHDLLTSPGARGSGRIVRGNGWLGTALSCRAAKRSRHPPSYRFAEIGFRVVRTGGAFPAAGPEPQGRRSNPRHSSAVPAVARAKQI